MEPNKKKKIVIKLGGSTLTNSKITERICEEISKIYLEGYLIVIVHGGGNEINKYLNKLNLTNQFIDGLRYTDEPTMEMVEMVLSGKVNKEIVNELARNACNAVGISGKDGNLFKAKPLSNENLGLVGEVDTIDIKILDILNNNGYLPVVSPVGTSAKFVTYNLNADYVASSLAGAWQADILCFLTDVDGLLMDIKEPNSIINEISTQEINDLISKGIINGGMIPKIDCCVKGVELGIKEVFMLNGAKESNLINKILNNKKIGTTFYR